MSTESKPSVLSPELIAMLEVMQANNNATILAAVAELRKPDEATAAKQEEAAELERRRLLIKIENAQREDFAKAEAQLTCSHTLPNGKTRLRGQRNSNGWIQAFCSECQFLSKPFPAAEQERDGGVNMGEWGPSAMLLINRRIAAAGRDGLTPPPIPRLPFGARITF